MEIKKKRSIKLYYLSNLVYIKISELIGCFPTGDYTVFHYNNKILTECYTELLFFSGTRLACCTGIPRLKMHPNKSRVKIFLCQVSERLEGVQ